MHAIFLTDEEAGDGEYVVAKIIDRRFKKGSSPGNLQPKDSDYEFLVQWEGYGPEENSWEPYENLSKCRVILDDFLELKRKRAMRNRKGKQI